MEVEEPVQRAEVDLEKKAKENSSAAGNHGDAQMNGMTNGYDYKKEHKSEHKEKDKERSHKSENKEKSRDKDREKDKEKSHKSEHRDKDRHKDKHSSSSSSKDKDKHSSSSSSKDKEKSRDKDKEKDKDKKSSSSSSRDKDREHKSSSSSSRDKEKDKERSKDKEHKSSSSSKDKDRHHSSSSSSKDKDREKDKERSKDKDKDREKHKDRHSSSQSSSRDKEKEKSSKDKEKKHSSDKDKERHSSSHSSDKHREKDKEKSSSDKHRHEKDRDKHRHDKEKSKHRDEKEKKEKVKEESKVKEEKVKEEPVSPVKSDVKEEVKVEPESFREPDEDYDSGDDSQRLYIKEEDEEMKEENSLDSTSNTRLSDMHNTTVKTEDGEDSEEDMPLASRSRTSGVKRKKVESESDDDTPLVVRKKPKKEPEAKKKKKKKDSEDEDEDYDEPDEKPKKKRKPKAQKANNTSQSSQPSPKKKKKEEEEQEVWKWWEEEKRDDGTKWHFLEHKGPVFAPAYEPLPDSVKFYYNGKEMKLSEETEEVATFYARMLEHDYTTKQVFNDNFFHDWREVMTESERAKITDLKKCNFTEMNKYFIQKSEERKAMSKEEKKALKEQNEEIQKEYGICTIDGHKEKIGNFKIEPPGLFRGRGEHPKMGKLKKRVVPEDVLINCSKDSVFPKAPPGHKWKEIRHDPTVTWLASWTENIQNSVKYVMLNPSSKLKGEKDWQKYETARKLAKSVDKIRATYKEDWKSKEMRIRQRAVALYFIDKLALRAGNEKDEDQADTVGCCSLRVEHISLHEQLDGKEYVVEFDFLGKDSIRYYNKVPVEKRVFKSLQLFMENKSPGDELFDRLNTTIMNKHLNELMEGLTAKVFRTYNASITLQQQLDELTDPDSTVAEKILSYNRANRAVAILCNHQRSVPKTHGKSMENMKAKIDAKKEAIQEAEKNVKDAKKDAKHGSVKEKVVYEKKKKQLERLREQLHKLELQITDKEENKDIALGTSKLNYLDPRISVAWCKKHDVPIEKIYNKTQRDKFRWAIDMAGPDYVF